MTRYQILLTEKNMKNPKKIEKLRIEIDQLRLNIENEVGSSTMDMINELIELELELEAECNR